MQAPSLFGLDERLYHSLRRGNRVGCAERCWHWEKHIDSRYVRNSLLSKSLVNDYEGTGGVSMFALKLARAAGLKVILSSSSDQKLEKLKQQFSSPQLLTVNYAKNPTWDDDVIRLTDGVGVDLVLENGGTGSLVKSMKCTRRGGIISQVGYLGKQNPQELAELVPLIIDRRLVLRWDITSFNREQGLYQ